MRLRNGFEPNTNPRLGMKKGIQKMETVSILGLGTMGGAGLIIKPDDEAFLKTRTQLQWIQ